MSKRPSPSPSPIPKARKPWTHLTDEEKQYILDSHNRGDMQTKIATSLGRPIGTISAFLKRCRQQNVSLGAALEMSMNSEDGDITEMFRESIERSGYSRKQVLSFQKTGLICNMMSQLTDTSAFKADRVTLVIGGNAEGDWKLKPLLVYHTDTPRALKGYIKEHFPVVWKAQPELLVTNDILQSYVVGYLSSACTEYAMANKLPNKFLLILDSYLANSPLHWMSQWAENIEVQFLPYHMQPMEEGVTDIFRRYYQRRVMQQLVKAMNEERKTSEVFWRQYTIKKAIHNISHSWNQVEGSVMNGVWYKVWQEAVHGPRGFQEVEDHRQQLSSDIVQFFHQAGMQQVDQVGVEVLLASHAEVTSDEEDVQLLPQEAEDPDLPQEAQGLIKTKLKELLDGINKASAIAESQDLNMSRSDKFSQALESAAQHYQKIYEEL